MRKKLFWCIHSTENLTCPENKEWKHFFCFALNGKSGNVSDIEETSFKAVSKKSVGSKILMLKMEFFFCQI